MDYTIMRKFNPSEFRQIPISEIQAGTWIRVGQEDYYYHGGAIFLITKVGEIERSDSSEAIYMISENGQEEINSAYYTHDEIKEVYIALDDYRDKQLNNLL